MPREPYAPGRRERNKQAKLDRIVSAATELFSQRSVDDVTTQEIADKADIGAGTLFLYVKSKGDLLLLVQNARYSAAFERGLAAAQEATNAVDAVIALATPIVECNRAPIENGHTYLREMMFGDPAEPNRATALSIVGQTQQAVADLIAEHTGRDGDDAAVRAQVISAILFLTMASHADPAFTLAEVMEAIRRQIVTVLPAVS
ncbi:TetR/AcrR family transcriptional regulator [Promicromonospora thailandica]|uniref:TetR family transcriptional regulator n=2 Tax=Promicromonospora TaxID=43676 RepID=A0A8H9GQB3_9MICO|nr:MULTISPECIES: TetR/AcrR family transcriptional regulator [Promicromonospora]MCP2265000.1 transcriptional regulator, TetR family [Promicromonospora thailandica]NNH54287.1 TetR/AcrR family transcriptional regulator [Promicromonospora citrea]BFF18713.1 TetR/AcrR family transcriptional regulator [Promicromonospora thailandica]GGM43346.1 TetR family transcriptional regulator [Promicromonospora citrea]